MVNKPLLRPYSWGGYVRGGRLTSHKHSNDGFSPNQVIQSDLLIPELEVTYPLNGSLNHLKKGTKNCQEEVVPMFC